MHSNQNTKFSSIFHKPKCLNIDAETVSEHVVIYICIKLPGAMCISCWQHPFIRDESVPLDWKQMLSFDQIPQLVSTLCMAYHPPKPTQKEFPSQCFIWIVKKSLFFHSFWCALNCTSQWIRMLNKNSGRLSLPIFIPFYFWLLLLWIKNQFLTILHGCTQSFRTKHKITSHKFSGIWIERGKLFRRFLCLALVQRIE